MAKDFKPGDTVELKHKETSFFDSETGFEITGGSTATLGDRIGSRTKRALVSGGLLVIETKPAPKAAAAPKAKPAAKKAPAAEAKDDDTADS